MDFVRSHLWKMQLWPVEHFFHHKRVPVFNWSELHLSEVFYKIHTLASLACPFYEGIQKGQKWIVAWSKEQKGYKIQNAIQLENDFHPNLNQRWMAKVLHKSVKALDFTLRLIYSMKIKSSFSDFADVHSNMILSHHMLLIWY